MDKQGNGTSNGADSSRGGILNQLGQLGSTASQFVSEARETVSGLKGNLDIAGRMERHPYAMLAGAAGVGYLLAGGLFSGLTLRLVRMGVKAAALPILRNHLLGLLETTLSQRSEQEQAQPHRSTAAPSSPGIA